MTGNVQSIIDKYQGVAPNRVLCAVQKAAARTGADFAYLMEKACTESSFDPTAKSKSSSATGLFQFIDSTWLTTVKQHGAKYGLGAYADQIEMKDGKPVVANEATRRDILALRKNPEISALMAGAYSKENECYLEKKTGCDVGATELYLAHFLGANGAAKFINAKGDDENAVAAQIFPQAARANHNVFFDKATGHARTLDEVYDLFANKFDTNPDAAAPSPASSTATNPSRIAHEVRSVRAPALSASLPGMAEGQAPLSSRDDGIARLAGTQKRARPVYVQKVTPAGILAMAQMMDTLPDAHGTRKDRYGFNS